MGKSEHVRYDIEYHIVWTTKYHCKILSGKIAERCRELIWQSCRAMEIKVLRGSIGKNYVHLTVSCPPNISVSKMVRHLKGKTSKIMMSEYKELRRRYWRQQMWARGYFCRSVGYVSKKMIKKYIESQEDEYGEI